jgi:hypothetical protein
MYPEDFPLNFKYSLDTGLDFAATLQKITSSRYLLGLLKEYLDEPDSEKRQLLAARILLSIKDRKAYVS